MRGDGTGVKMGMRTGGGECVQTSPGSAGTQDSGGPPAPAQRLHLPEYSAAARGLAHARRVASWAGCPGCSAPGAEDGDGAGRPPCRADVCWGRRDAAACAPQRGNKVCGTATCPGFQALLLWHFPSHPAERGGRLNCLFSGLM